jgi:hypothetical protein
MKCVKTQEEWNNGERSEATEIGRAELCMVDTLSSLLFCADILRHLAGPMQIARQLLHANARGF